MRLTAVDRKLAWEMAQKSKLYVGCVKTRENAEYILQHLSGFDQGLAHNCFYCGKRQWNPPEAYTQCCDCGKKCNTN